MLTLNGEHVFEGVLSFPRTGAWHADLKVDALAALSGSATINVDQGRYLLQGTIVRAGNWQDTGFLRVVGGAGGLRTLARPKHYTSTSLRIVLDDLLLGAGEQLSPTSDQSIVGRAGGRALAAWTTATLPVGRLLTQLLVSAGGGATWRVLPNGTVWVGQETWPDSKLKESDFQTIDEEPARAEALLGVESPLLMPGVTLGGRRVSYVEHRLSEPHTRTAVWFETGGTTDDRLKAALRGVVKAAQQPIDYLAKYFATVVAQDGQRIDVKPSDPRIPSMAAVPLFGGLPGWEMKVKPGGRVLIGWSGGDPTQPYAEAFDAGVQAVSLALLADLSIVIGNKAGAQAVLLSTPYRAAEDRMIDALVTGVQAALSSLGLVPAASALSAAQVAFHAASPTFLSTHVRHS